VRGRLYTVLPANPAAGAEISVPVPAGKRWLFKAMKYRFVTSATVANRNSLQRWADGAGNVFASSGQNLNQAAGGTFDYYIAPGIGTAAYGVGAQQQVHNHNPPLGLELAAGYTIGTLTFGIQAGDQYSAVVILVEEWDA
jgi:hypothetical protein